jgi:sugar lactone lactonase YvrE
MHEIAITSVKNVRRFVTSALFIGLAALAGCPGAMPQAGSENQNSAPPVNMNGTGQTNDNTNTNQAPAPARPVITTIVGAGFAGFNGESGAPLELALYLPQDVTIGPDGALYICDWNNHRIRRMMGDNVETILGTGQIGDAPDGDPLSSALNHPTNVAFDHQGRLLVAAWHNSKVKRLDFTTGLFENVAGTGRRAYSGDGGPPNMADLDLPSSVDLDSNGNIYISDQANQRIRVVETTDIIETICGDGTQGYLGDGQRAEMARLNSPVGQAAPPAGRLDVDSRDRIFIADTANHVIRLINNDGTISTVAGNGTAGYSGDGGPATAAQLDTPSDIEAVVDANGGTTLYIADTFNNVIRRVNPDGTIETIAGTGTNGFSGDGGPATEAQLDRPYGLTVAPNGEVYIADTHNHRIRRITAELPPDFDPNQGGNEPPVQIIPCTDQVGSICTYAGTGLEAFNGDNKDRLRTALYWPFDIEFTPSGRTYVLDWNNHRVREIRPDDTLVTVVGTDFVGDGPPELGDLVAPGALGTTVALNHPTDLIELPNGNLTIIAWHNHKIRQYDPVTGLVTVIMGRNAAFAGDGGPASPDARVNQVAHGVLDPDGNLFIVDQRNQRIRVIRDYQQQLGAGIITTVLGTGMAGFNGDDLPPLETQVRFPAGSNPEPTGGIAMDANGVIYFADTLNHRLRSVEFTDLGFDSGVVAGTVRTIAGTGTAGNGGDGGPATAADINFPGDLEIGPDGNLYFADTNNSKVRMIDLTTGIITTIAGTGQRGYSGDGGLASTAMLSRPFGVAFDAAGDLYVSDTFNGRIRKIKR